MRVMPPLHSVINLNVQVSLISRDCQWNTNRLRCAPHDRPRRSSVSSILSTFACRHPGSKLRFGIGRFLLQSLSDAGEGRPTKVRRFAGSNLSNQAVVDELNRFLVMRVGASLEIDQKNQSLLRGAVATLRDAQATRTSPATGFAR